MSSMMISAASKPVAPHWGAWIEINGLRLLPMFIEVAPHWGAWIEILYEEPENDETMSHPTGVRGLK